jgi:murein DD-endopeptidase MepM/ murein hydrolase activator NlpD
VGDRVERGEVIGTSGDTGYSTGPHLHVELRHAGVPVDPVRYLP